MSDRAYPPSPPRLPPLGRPAWRLILVAGLFIALLLPQYMIASLIEEREDRQADVQREIATAWGRPQTLLGPVLVVPTRGADGTRGSLALLPAQANVRVLLEPETRRRGIFAAVVYRARLEVTGQLAPPPLDIAEGVPDWREAALVLAASDLRATPTDPEATWDGRALGAGEAPAEPACGGLDALAWPLRLQAAPEPGRPVPFSLAVELRGSAVLQLLPAARRTGFEATGPWPTPAFSGRDLPERSEVTPQGFRATWLAASRLGLAQPGLGWCERLVTAAGEGQQVSLLEAVPTYRMVNRAAKYGELVLALALLTYLLFELLARVAIHPVQYGLVGLSVTLFPLLLLAVGEPIGFSPAFLVAAGMVTAQAGAYTAMVTRRAPLAVVFAGVLGAMFAFVHVVLSLESYALLAGAVALFAALSVLMVATRGVRWGGP